MTMSTRDYWIIYFLFYRFIFPRSTQPSIPPGRVNQVPACLAGVKVGRVFTCVGWQVICEWDLCDPIWQVMLRSSVMGFQSTTSSTHLYLLPIMFRTRRRWTAWRWVFCWVTRSSWTTTGSTMPWYLCLRPGPAVTSCLGRAGRRLMPRLSSTTWPSAGACWATCRRLRRLWNDLRCPVVGWRLWLIGHSCPMDRCFCTPFAGCHAFLIRFSRCVDAVRLIVTCCYSCAS